ncbi:MAG TPA: phosphatase PAP2 family protein [Polyangiales bacterium]
MRWYLLLSLVWLVPLPGLAGEAKPLAYDLRVDLPIALIGSGLWIASGALQDQLTPERCRWCDDNAFDARARQSLRWSDPAPAGPVSDALVAGVVPLVSLGGIAVARALDGANLHDTWLDALFVVEATSVAALMNQLVKFAAARERPYTHAGEYEGQPRGSFERTSFYSGHTTLAFALASASGMVASLRGLRAAPAIWSVALVAATFVGYARVAGDFHYLSDVLTGAGLGCLVGAGLPWLMHRPRASVNLRVSAGAGTLVIGFQH